MLLSGEPSIIGRDPTGHSATVITHQPAATVRAPVHTTSCLMRRAGDMGAGEKVHEVGRRNDGEGLDHLGQEGKTEQRSGSHEPAGSGLLERTGEGVGARDQQQREQRVGVVVPEHQRRHRCQRQDRAGQQASRAPNQRLTVA